MNELIEGNWYEVNTVSRWVFKFLRFEEPNKIWNSKSGVPGNNYRTRTNVIPGYLRTTPDQCKLANMNEVFKLFPEEKDLLLEEAKKRYPVGSKFNNNNIINWVNTPIEVDTDKFVFELENVSKKTAIFYVLKSSSKYTVWLDQKWAEIVEEPKQVNKHGWVEGKWYISKDRQHIGKFMLDNNGEKYPYYYPCKEYIYNRVYRSSEGHYSIDFMSNEEVPLEEIQQYLPEGHPDLIVKEFVLPEKWCVKANSSKIVQKWFLSKGEDNISDYVSHSSYETYYFHFPLNGLNYYANKTKEEDYTEITFDQFKKYVLKDSIKEEAKAVEEWNVGSYVVFLQNYGRVSNKGAIDKILKSGGETVKLEKEGISPGPEDEDVNKYLKWFPTLQEAQKFSDELLGKNKTDLRVEDLVEGEIYYWEYLPYKYISKCLGGFKSGASIYLPDNKFTNDEENIKTGSIFVDDYSWNIRNVTSLEKKWLKTCIKQDKFIEQSELDKYDDEGNLIQVKQKEEFKDGEWLVYIEPCNYICTTIPIKVGDVKQLQDGKFGSLTIYGLEDHFRRALPHEIPTSNPNHLDLPGMSSSIFRIDLADFWNSKQRSSNLEISYNPKIDYNPIYKWEIDPISTPKTILSVETDEEPRMVIPRPETKVNRFISIEE